MGRKCSELPEGSKKPRIPVMDPAFNVQEKPRALSWAESAPGLPEGSKKPQIPVMDPAINVQEKPRALLWAENAPGFAEEVLNPYGCHHGPPFLICVEHFQKRFLS